MSNDTEAEEATKFSDDHAKWIFVITICSAVLFSGVVFLFIL
jgi:hypothetical protein